MLGGGRLLGWYLLLADVHHFVVNALVELVGLRLVLHWEVCVLSVLSCELLEDPPAVILSLHRVDFLQAVVLLEPLYRFLDLGLDGFGRLFPCPGKHGYRPRAVVRVVFSLQSWYGSEKYLP